MARKKKNRFDDRFQAYLTEKANFVGKIKMPEILDLQNTSIPKELISFEKIKSSKNKRGYIHFYCHDKIFEEFIAIVPNFLGLLSEYDGVITPDCSLAIGQLDYLQMTNTYFNRAVGVYLQQHNIPVIPTVRWSDASSYEYCFNGLPKHSILAISTYGCINSKEKKIIFKQGLNKMIEILEPIDVLVYGYMPSEIFDDLKNKTNFHNYPNPFEQNCKKEV